MVTAWQVVANARPPVGPRVWWDSRFLLAAAGLVALILAGALVIAWLERWRKRSVSDAPDLGDELAQFRELYERGELSQAEFERIRGKLTGQLLKQLNVPNIKAAGPQPAQPNNPQPEQPDPGTRHLDA